MAGSWKPASVISIGSLYIAQLTKCQLDFIKVRSKRVREGQQKKPVFCNLTLDVTFVFYRCILVFRSGPYTLFKCTGWEVGGGGARLYKVMGIRNQETLRTILEAA